MTNTETMNAKRAEYMAGHISHDEYYLWLSDFIGVTAKDLPVSLEQLRASTDPHMNDIELRLWDNRDPIIRNKAYAKRLPWSLSDTVCCLKAVARKAIA